MLRTLEEIATQGIEPELIESSLHQFEIAQKEVSNSGYPYALGVMFRLLGPWMQGGDPVTGLRLDAQLGRLRADLAQGAVFEPMLRDLLANPTASRWKSPLIPPWPNAPRPTRPRWSSVSAPASPTRTAPGSSRTACA